MTAAVPNAAPAPAADRARHRRILAINPGSTSTKVAVYEGYTEAFRATIEHAATELDAFATLTDQLPYRRKAIDETLRAAGVDVSHVDAVVGRGGGLVPLVGGTYAVNDALLADARSGRVASHPATLGCQLANLLAVESGARAFVVNPPDVDELAEVARVTGLSGVVRQSRVHALNHKEVAHRFAASLGRRYEDLDVVVAHLGGGISVAAHRRGRMVEVTDALNGDGPMAPTRCGAVPVRDVIEACFSGRYTQAELTAKTSRTGGLVDHFGTSDARVVARRAAAGDEHARLVYEAMVYQVGKSIGACVAVLHGHVDGILLTGGLACDGTVVDQLTAMVAALGPVRAFPGELEMEALSAGVLRVLDGQEQVLEYTGRPVWDGFAWDRAGQRTEFIEAGGGAAS